MKTIVLFVAMFVISQQTLLASECTKETVRRTFTATNFSSNSNSTCNLEKTEKEALVKCERSGFVQCSILFSDRTSDLTDAGVIEVCSATARGTKTTSTGPFCL